MSRGTLILRADASVAIGTGHVMRCLALAQAWQDAGGRAVFAMAETSTAIQVRLLAEGLEILQLEEAIGSAADAVRLVELARGLAADWVVVDGYQFGATYQDAVKAGGLKLLFLDDNGHAGRYSADLVLNQNAHADQSFYKDRQAYTRILLGPRYALLRREFAKWRDWKREIPPIGRKVLVTMGGSDPDNVTQLVIEALLDLPMEGMETVVVVGGSNPHTKSLQRLLENYETNIRLRTNVSNMPELMAWADFAIAAAGSTTLELCFLGLPAILLALVDNQRAIAKALSLAGATIYLDFDSGTINAYIKRLSMSATDRLEMAKRETSLVDGRGAERVCQKLEAGK